MYYVYLYLREDRTPYYVGKGSGKRINQKHRFSDGKFLPLPPVDRRAIIKYFDDEEECFLFEEWLIEFYGRKLDGGILNNQCKGGGGYTRGRNFDRAKYNEKNKEKIAARQKRYREKNKEKIAARQKRYREKNKESLRQKQKENYQKRKEDRGNYWYDNISKEEYNKKTRERYYRRKADGYKRNDEERKKEYRKKNSEKQKAYMKEYYQKNKDKWNNKKIKDTE
jgi:hypothetical protein